MYKWKLEKYNGQKSRFTCPNCGKKNQFTRYQDSHGNYAPDKYGICNRIIKCGYKAYPDHITTEANYFPKYTPAIIYDTINVKEYNDLLPKLETNSNLIVFLSKFFDEDVIWDVLNLYHIRTDKNMMVFPCISNKNSITGVKMMEYKKDGHRTKHIYNPYKGLFKYCLFGLHLKDQGKPIYVVESEKTAIVCALHYPEFTWMATGGLNNLYKLNDLEQATIFPDKGKSFDYWTEKLEARFDINDTIENEEYLKDGDDLADYILHHKQELNVI